MTPRGLHLPARKTVVGAAIVIFSLVTLTHVGWAMKMGLASHAPGIATSIMASLACLLLVAGAIEGQHRLEDAGWSFEEAGWSRWMVFYGVWLGVGLGIGLARVAVLQARSGMPLTPSRAGFVVFVCVYMTMLMLVALERQAMFRTTISRKQEVSRRALSFLFRTREAFVKARDRHRYEALDLLDRQVDPELAAIHEDLTRLRAEGRSARTLEALVHRLERLRVVEIRQLSHLLHPSIIDMGLAPALRALVRNRSADLPIHLEIAEASLEGLAPASCLQLYRIVELALDWARQEAVGEVRVVVAGGSDAPLRLEVAMAGGGHGREPGAESGLRALLEARVALLGDAWSLERDGEKGTCLRVSQPPALEGTIRA